MIVNTKLMNEALKIHKKVIEKRATLPILANVLIEARNGSITLTSTDLETTARTTIAADGADEFTTTVNVTQFADVLKNHKNPTVEIIATDDGVRMAVGSATLMTITADEYPAGCAALANFDASNADDGGAFERADVTMDDFARVAPAIGADETRPYLNGVYVNSSVCATDGHRLHVIAKRVCERHAIIPSKAVGIIMGVKPVSFAMFVGDKRSRAVVTLKNGMTAFFGIRNVDGNFPDFSGVIPNERHRTRVVTANRDAITGALRGAYPFADTCGRGVKIGHVADGADLEISVKNPNTGDFATSGGIGTWINPMEIGFNAKYLLDSLSVMRGDAVKIEMTDQHSPCVMCEDDLTAVIMPMRL